ncbi:MAG: hypothetical protein ACWA47_05300 [Brevirhabdus sp.]
MKQTAFLPALTAALLIGAAPFAPVAQAQETTSPEAEQKLREGAELLNEGLQLLLNGMKDDVVPLLEDLRDQLGDEVGPLVEGLRGKLDELNAYYPPEVLPNGDIIIRRKVPLQVEPGADGEVEL